MSTTPSVKTQEIIHRYDQAMVANLPRYSIVMARGEGCYLWDIDGKQYLDLFAGFGAGLLGHCHPDLVAAVTQQASTLWHVGNLFHNDPQTRLAQAIHQLGFGGQSFFCHSGADANEAAIKLARLFGKERPGKAPNPALGRYKIITAHQSFHGRTFGTMVATGQDKVRKGFEPLLEGFLHVPFNDLEAVRRAIDPQTVAVMVEPIQGEGGCNVPDDGYLPGLRKLCDQLDMLLICDEVWTGGGRTGRYFAHQHWNIAPDIMTLAKGVGGGLPVGVMCAGPRCAPMYDYRHHGLVAHATTLGGNLLSMAVGAKIFDVLQRDHLVQHAAQLGQYAVERLRDMSRSLPAIKCVRGKGLFLGIDLDPSAPGVWFKNAADVVNRCMDRGVLINGTQNTVLRLAPPLTLTRQQLDDGLKVLQEVIAGQ